MYCALGEGEVWGGDLGLGIFLSLLCVDYMVGRVVFDYFFFGGYFGVKWFMVIMFNISDCYLLRDY